MSQEHRKRPKQLAFTPTQELLDHIHPVVDNLASIAQSYLRTGKVELKNVGVFLVMQGYLTGCMDVINSEHPEYYKDEKFVDYIIKLRTLLRPIQLLVQDAMDRVEREEQKRTTEE